MTVTFVSVPRGTNLLDDPSDVLVNTVNCVGVMGAGLAKQFKQRHPDMFAQYQADCRKGLVTVGRMHSWQMPDGRFIINFPTKKHWRDPAQLEWVQSGLDDLVRGVMVTASMAHPITTVAVPPLGCGLGGLEWATVKPMIVAAFNRVTTHDVAVRIYEP